MSMNRLSSPCTYRQQGPYRIRLKPLLTTFVSFTLLTGCAAAETAEPAAPLAQEEPAKLDREYSIINDPTSSESPICLLNSDSKNCTYAGPSMQSIRCGAEVLRFSSKSNWSTRGVGNLAIGSNTTEHLWTILDGMESRGDETITILKDPRRYADYEREPDPFILIESGDNSGSALEDRMQRAANAAFNKLDCPIGDGSSPDIGDGKVGGSRPPNTNV